MYSFSELLMAMGMTLICSGAVSGIVGHAITYDNYMDIGTIGKECYRNDTCDYGLTCCKGEDKHGKKISVCAPVPGRWNHE